MFDRVRQGLSRLAGLLARGGQGAARQRAPAARHRPPARRDLWRDSWPAPGAGRSWRTSVLVSLPLVLLALAGLAYGTATVLWQSPAGPLPQVARPPDPLAALSTPIVNELTRPDAVLPARLKLSFTGRPEDLCAQLNDLGLTNSGWRRAPFHRARYQCASDLVELTTASVDYGPATLFFLLRGPGPDRIDYLRLKLNVEDPKQIEIGQDAARLVIGQLSTRYGWAVPQPFLDAITTFRAVELTDRGVRLSVAPEDPALTGDPLAAQRLNIIVDFGEPELIRPASQFEITPPFRAN